MKVKYDHLCLSMSIMSAMQWSHNISNSFNKYFLSLCHVLGSALGKVSYGWVGESPSLTSEGSPGSQLCLSKMTGNRKAEANVLWVFHIKYTDNKILMGWYTIDSDHNRNTSSPRAPAEKPATFFTFCFNYIRASCMRIIFSIFMTLHFSLQIRYPESWNGYLSIHQPIY